ncbi:hypothetical protein [Phenylobacterium sp.]|uniref:hypothetical protein n=1 Tax=Phenylobacterium sp. TaxID=1871053 RepID=UPI003784D15D
MPFVVDGADWRFDGMALGAVASTIDQALSLVSDAAAAGETVWIGDDFQHRPMLGGEDLWTIFERSGALALPSQLLQELTAWLMTAPRYADAEVWPEGAEEIDISIDGAATTANPDVAWVHHSLRAGQKMAVLSLSRSGSVATATKSGHVDAFFVSTRRDRRMFWRSILENPRGLELLLEVAPKAYPDIHFVDGALSGANDFTGGYLPFRDAVHAALAALDDFGAWVFTAPPPPLTPTEPPGVDRSASPSHQVIEERFRRLGIDAAPEKPDVYLSPTKRRAREVTIQGETHYCEWHIRIQKHQNRIHIHAPTRPSGGQVVVAILHSHLP